MERATSPCLRSKTFSSACRTSSSMIPYRGTNELPSNSSKRRLEFDDPEGAPYASSLPSVRAPTVRDTSMARGFASTTVSSVYQTHSTWNQRHLDSQLLGLSNLSDHAKHARLLDLSSHSRQPALLGGGTTLRPPGRRVDSGDDELLEAPSRLHGKNDENASCYSGRGGSGGGSAGGGGGSDDKSQVTLTSVRSRSVVSRQHSILSLDNLSFCTELHAVMQRQASQSSLCSFASHAIHKRRNSWGSTCGDSTAGTANVPPYLLRLTSASSALSSKAGGGGLQVAEDQDLSRDDGSAGSWLQHVTSIRLDATTVSQLRRDRFGQHRHQHHGQRRPSNPITADARWLRQLSSRSLSSFTTITTTTTTHATERSPPLPSTLAMRTPVAKGPTRTPYPSPEECGPRMSTRHGGDPQDGAGTTSKLPTQRLSAEDRECSAPWQPQPSPRYSPEQPPYYRGAVIRRISSTHTVSHRSVVASEEGSTAANVAASWSPPSETVSSEMPPAQYQPPLPLRQALQAPQAAERPRQGRPGTEERMAPSWAPEEMEVEEA